jgi:hypothetical protein
MADVRGISKANFRVARSGSAWKKNLGVISKKPKGPESNALEFESLATLLLRLAILFNDSDENGTA